MNRRDFLKTAAGVAAGAILTQSLPGKMARAFAREGRPAPEAAPAVYMTRDISPDGLAAAYRALGRPASGRVAVKISTGEPGGHHYLAPGLIGDLVHSVNGTFVECNTAYGGRRASTESHRRAAEEHGFTAIAPVDIQDSDGETRLPVRGGTHLKENIVGSHFGDYDFILTLSHFKGHAMAGFGGAIKNISIGFASSGGKALIHTAGKSSTNAFLPGTRQDDFLESMAEAAGSVVDRVGGNIVYVNVMNNLSIDCDCASNPAKPEMRDIGILASLDPVALDKACVDLVYAADPAESASLRRRMESKNGVHTLAHAEKLGLGSLHYSLVEM